MAKKCQPDQNPKIHSHQKKPRISQDLLTLVTNHGIIKRFAGIGFPSSSKELVVVPKNKNDANGYYEVLGVRPDASKTEIQRAFRKIAKVIHPEGTNPDEEAFIQIVEVYETLINDQTRAQYNKVTAGFRFVDRATASDLRKSVPHSEWENPKPKQVKFTYFAFEENDELAQKWYSVLVPAYQALSINRPIRIALLDVELPTLEKYGKFVEPILVIPKDLKPSFFIGIHVLKTAFNI